ncbi:MAG: AmmeMemoRadiSam system protein B [Candidatus Scalindua sp. AMX11]|nr:MAG: AmmeMemoRadiSam system protein B [Candidatus Scalindua sp.]NOG86093.1 AmmeMemoRadiSam system protein B [Planctomycetota bacterium]RZV98860.1 MAG: AmmeMemoRadiSam system protein B [Candidatus Scalindua sp. SCAELEC01]TDE66948.1 MAG: AmmeMemoRadiSam system protein B [Candidatus Scalindua sp. AMX11]GJQ57755.1 MAG: MEMO1 family protein [Candidatus Scalindua sp.]
MEYPKLRPIEAFPIEQAGEQAICLRDPLNYAENTLVVPHHVFYIISHFDGTHSALDIQAKYSQQYGNLLFSDNIAKIIEELDKNLFLDNDRSKSFIKKVVDDFKNSTIRKAIHAGTAYENDEQRLRKQMDHFFTSPDGPGKPSSQNSTDLLKGVIAPHIDLRNGGPCFAWAYKEIAESSDAELFIIFGIAHSGTNNLFALTNKTFETPFGPVQTDKDFLKSLQKRLQFNYHEDEFVHKNEHSIEFQLMFLQYLYHKRKNFKILPILCSSFEFPVDGNGSPMKVPQLENFISSLKETIEKSKKRVCLIASVDLAHVGLRFGDTKAPDETFLRKLEDEDLDLLKQAENLDAEAFYENIRKNNDKRRICGYPAIYALLNVIKAKEGKLLKYSQDNDQNSHSTVTFASMAFY